MYNTSSYVRYVYIVHSIQYYLPFAFRIYMRWYEIQEHMYIWYYMKFKKSSKNASNKDNIQHIISFVTNTVKNVITHPTFQSLQDYTLDTIFF